jgi:hypothetical protein
VQRSAALGFAGLLLAVPPLLLLAPALPAEP